MNLFKRLLAASGAAGLLVGLGVATPVFAATSGSATIEQQCAAPASTQHISVQTASGNLVHIEVKVGTTTVSATGIVGDSGAFIGAVIVPSVPSVLTASVWIFGPEGVAFGSGSFAIALASTPCPTPNAGGSFDISSISRTQVGGKVQKTCDAGLSGDAVFTPTITVNVVDSNIPSTTITLPSSITLTLSCNGKAKDLPVLPESSVITLHEATAPAGAVAAADTKITFGAQAATTTIHNAKKPAVVIVLPATGLPANTPAVPWPVFALLGLIAIAGAGLVLSRRS